MRGFKGFNKKFQCCPKGKVFQYEVGKTYEEPVALCCERGLHFCTHPIDVFNYYDPIESRFAEVEAIGEVNAKLGEDTKCSTTKIRICRELTLDEMIQEATKLVSDRNPVTKESHVAAPPPAAFASGADGVAFASVADGVASASGVGGAAFASGDDGVASASGYRGVAFASGADGVASASGEKGIACAHGKGSRAKATLGSWIVCSEWRIVDDELKRTDVKAAKIDGEKLKSDTFYTLRDGKFVEAQ